MYVRRQLFFSFFLSLLSWCFTSTVTVCTGSRFFVFVLLLLFLLSFKVVPLRFCYGQVDGFQLHNTPTHAFPSLGCIGTVGRQTVTCHPLYIHPAEQYPRLFSPPDCESLQGSVFFDEGESGQYGTWREW